MSRPRIKARVYTNRSYAGSIAFGSYIHDIAAKAIDGRNPLPGVYGYETTIVLPAAARDIIALYGPWLIFFKQLKGSRIVCVHGGSLDPSGKLLPTEHDCIRMSNSGLAQLAVAVQANPVLRIEETEIGWFKSWSAEKLSLRHPIMRATDFACGNRAKNAVRRAAARPIDNGDFDDHPLFWLIAMSHEHSHSDAAPPPFNGKGGDAGGAGATASWDPPGENPADATKHVADRGVAAAAGAGIVAGALLSGSSDEKSAPTDDKAADAAADAADDAVDNVSGNDTATTETSTPDVGGGGGSGDP